MRPSHRDSWRAEPHAEEWLLIEWPEEKNEPTKYWLSTLAETTRLEELVATAKLRWRIERDYQELKQELGLDHFEGRGWRGFHHHATLCIAAYGFLIRERSLFPLETVSAAKRLRYPPIGGRPGIPLRPERHDPFSVTSVRRWLTVALARRLPRCPCCQQQYVSTAPPDPTFSHL